MRRVEHEFMETGLRKEFIVTNWLIKKGDLSCSPFHVRFGKFSLLRPSQKKVDFSVNGHKTDLPMKLGEGGEAFFVFETEGSVPKALITSPVVSPSGSPVESPGTPDSLDSNNLQEPEFLDLSGQSETPISQQPGAADELVFPDDGSSYPSHTQLDKRKSWDSMSSSKYKEEAAEKVKKLTKRLTDINIPSKISDNGDIILDVTGYKSNDNDFQEAEEVIKNILSKELGIDFDIESGLDSSGKLRIFSKEQDQFLFDHDDLDAYNSDGEANLGYHGRLSEHQFDSDSALAAPASPGRLPSLASSSDDEEENGSHYVKTLRLTSEQLHRLKLNRGMNEVTFSVREGKAICSSRMFYWSYKDPIVISDIDGTITKSDALGQLLTIMGRDWTHSGVAKLFTDIKNNGYNIMYLTSRSVGQADSTRSYLSGIDQDDVKIPAGPVILSPDRTIAALRREVIMKKPEIFKMACLKDIQNLFGLQDGTPFYAGFGNRITDALSYRYVGVPSSKIFTINSNSEVHMELLELAGYKSSYVHIADLVDHFFPPVNIQGKSATSTQANYTDSNYWREPLIDLSDLSEEEEDGDSAPSGAHNNTADVDKNPKNDSGLIGDARQLLNSSLQEGLLPVREGESTSHQFVQEHPQDSYDDDDDDDEDDDDEDDQDDEYDEDGEYDDDDEYDDQEDLDGDLLDGSEPYSDGHPQPTREPSGPSTSPSLAPLQPQIRTATEMMKETHI